MSYDTPQDPMTVSTHGTTPTPIIAAAIREATEQKDREAARLQMELDATVCAEQHRQVVADRDALRHENNCLLVRLNAETDVLRAERNQLRAEVEQERRMRQTMETRHGEVVADSTQLRAALNVAEGALILAEPIVTAAVVREDEDGPYADPAARAASLSVHQALARIAATRTP